MDSNEGRFTTSRSDKRHERDRERDEELKKLLASNLPKYFELLMLAYASKLIAFVSWNGNPDCAEDIVQETFIKAYNALAKSSVEQIRSMNIRPWLYAIARNLSSNYRTRYTRFSSISTDTQEGRDLLEKIENGQYPSPDGEVEQKEAYSELYLCISRLPDRFRLPVLLHYISDLKYQEVAEILQQPFDTVKSNGLRGLKKLRNMMGKES
jgi:RNA polymerase sigma-70 factor (ECF subfamily)